MEHIKYVCLSLLIIGLAACGGSGGNSSSRDDPSPNPMSWDQGQWDQKNWQ